MYCPQLDTPGESMCNIYFRENLCVIIMRSDTTISKEICFLSVRVVLILASADVYFIFHYWFASNEEEQNKENIN